MPRTSAHPSCVRACICLSICYLISTVRVGWEFTRKRNISKGLIRFATVASSRSTRVCRRKTTSKNSRFFDFSFSFSFTLLSLFSFSPASIPLFWLINPFKSRGFMSSRGHADPLSLSLSSSASAPAFHQRGSWHSHGGRLFQTVFKIRKRKKMSRDPGRFLLLVSIIRIYARIIRATLESADRAEGIYVEAFSFHRI